MEAGGIVRISAIITISNFNPLPLLFKALLPGQKDCVFFSAGI
jgi:hypothetical protein